MLVEAKRSGASHGAAGAGWSVGDKAFGPHDFRQGADGSHAPGAGKQHLGFKLGHEEFLLPVGNVREIIMLPTITFVPRAPAAVEGILALRGEIMPVLNLRRLWGMDRAEVTSHTRVLILQFEESGFGLVVDGITDFITLDESQIESVPSNFFSQEYAVLEGVAKVGDKVRGVLGFEKLLGLLPLAEEPVEGEGEDS